MTTQSYPQTSEDLASENKNKITIEYGNETPYELKKTKISSENTVTLKYGTNQSLKIYNPWDNTRGGGGTPLYGLYRYVRRQRVWFFGCFGHK